MKFSKCIKKSIEYYVVEWDGTIETIAHLNSILYDNKKDISIEYENDLRNVPNSKYLEYREGIVISVHYHDVDKIIIDKESNNICKSKGMVHLESINKSGYYIVQESEGYKINIQFWSKDAFEKCFEFEEKVDEKNDSIMN